MTEAIQDRIYRLLPAVYRVRDSDAGEPLRALLAVIETELLAIEGDIRSLYDNWFIETCAEWIVPYIGDLLDVRQLNQIRGVASQRAWVANTIGYRRRKGTAVMLQQLARDVTGWPARAVEFFQLLATTQQLNHVRPTNVRTPDLRDTASLELLGTPFEQAAYTADVRSIALTRGKYNVPNVGLFLWRLQPYSIERVTPAPATGTPGGCYQFNPLGRDLPLFNPPQTAAELTQLATERDVPGALRRRPLYDELQARRQAGATPPVAVYFGPDSVLRVFVDDPADAKSAIEVQPDAIQVCDLDGWDKPGWKSPPGNSHILVAVDPALGRLALPTGSPHTIKAVDYTYAFSTDMGGGPYERRDSVATWLDPLRHPPTWQLGVTTDPATVKAAPDPKQLVSALGDAIVLWNAFAKGHPGAFGVIALMENRTLVEKTLKPIEVPAGSTLAIVAAQWPVIDVPGAPGMGQRIVGQIVADRLRPHLFGDLSVQGTAGGAGMSGGNLVLDGLLVQGTLTVAAGDLGGLRVNHCSLEPTHGGLVVQTAAGLDNNQLVVTIDHSICGAVVLTDLVQGLHIADSIIDHPKGGDAIQALGTLADIQRTTVFGTAHVQSLEAGNSIFSDIVTVDRRQAGCVRFSALRQGSDTPRRFRCQPDLALKDVTDPLKQATILARMVPSFTSERYGDPGYAQLGRTCGMEIRSGAEDGSAMGAFSSLREPQREANLQTSLPEYLRFGLEAGIFYVT